MWHGTLDLKIRVIDATGPDAATSVRWVSHYETQDKCFYGTRVGPGWYQGNTSEVPGKDRCRRVFPVFQILMLREWASARASVLASPGLCFSRFVLVVLLVLVTGPFARNFECDYNDEDEDEDEGRIPVKAARDLGGIGWIEPNAGLPVGLGSQIRFDNWTASTRLGD